MQQSLCIEMIEHIFNNLTQLSLLKSSKIKSHVEMIKQLPCLMNYAKLATQTSTRCTHTNDKIAKTCFQALGYAWERSLVRSVSSVPSNVSQIHVPANLIVIHTFRFTRAYHLESLHEPLIHTLFILELISRFSLTAIACITYKWLVQRQLYR